MSLQARILVLTVLISAAVLSITDWITTLTSVRAVENTIGAQTDNAARHLADDLEHSPAANFPSQFRNEVRRVLELEPNVDRVDVYADFDNQIRLVETSSSQGNRVLDGNEIGAFRASKIKTFTVESNGTRQIFSVHPLQFADTRKGFVTVVSSLQAVDAILGAHSRIRFYSLLVTTISLVAAITLLFRTTVYRSVHHLVDVMQRFREGDSRARAEENLAGEFGELAQHFNQMLEEMQRFHEDLRQGIASATDELAARNRELQKMNLDLYETQKRLTQAERLALLGQMTAIFAHEIGSPLSAISTHLQMLLEDSQLEPPVHDRLRLANDQIDRVCSIVESLLTSIRQTHRRVPVELREIVQKVAHLLGPTLESREVHFELEATGQPFYTDGDPDQLQQLFLNLFNNSLDAVQNSGTILVGIRRITSAVRTERNQFEILFSDSGIGISPDKLDHIFEPFFTTKEFGKGTGLGLALCKEIVAQHSGRITVASPSGGGACFTIILPEAQSVSLKREKRLAAEKVERS